MIGRVPFRSMEEIKEEEPLDEFSSLSDSRQPSMTLPVSSTMPSQLEVLPPESIGLSSGMPSSFPSFSALCANEKVTTSGTYHLDNLASFGNMFDVQIFDYSLILTQLDFHTDVTQSIHFELFVRQGTFRSAMTNISMWTLLKKGSIPGRGRQEGTPITGLHFELTPHTQFGFYITLNTTDLRYRNIQDEFPTAVVGTPFITTDDLQIQVGVSVGDFPMSNTFVGKRAWSGTLHYDAHRDCSSINPSLSQPSSMPTIVPTNPYPSIQPTIFPSTHFPSFEPTMIHSDFPSTSYPSSAPSITHSMIPSLSPTTIPTTQPSDYVPSRQPTLSSSYLPSPLPSSSATPSIIPTITNQTNICQEHFSVGTSFDGGTGGFGNMFTVTSKENGLVIATVSLHALINGVVTAEVYMRHQNFVGYESEAKEWVPVAHASIQVHGQRVMIPRENFNPIQMQPNQTIAMYVTLTTSDLRYTKANATVGSLIAESQYLTVNVGVGLADYPFANEFFIYSPRAFNGEIFYDIEAECLPTTDVVFAVDIQLPPNVESNEAFQLIQTTLEQLVQQLMSTSEVLSQHVDHFKLSIENVYVGETANASCTDATKNFRCLPVDSIIYLRHTEDLRPGKLRFDLLAFRENITFAIESHFDTSYVGEVSTSAGMKVKMDATTSVDEMGEDQIKAYEQSAKLFLQEFLSDQNIGILDVNIISQAIKSSKQRHIIGNNDRKLEGEDQLMTTVEIETEVLAEYRPPPDLIFSEVLDDTLTENADKLSERVKSADPYFDVFENTTIETIKEDHSAPPSVNERTIWLSQTWGEATVTVASLVGAMLMCYWCRFQKRRQNNKSKLENLVSTEGLSHLKMQRGGVQSWVKRAFKKKSRKPEHIFIETPLQFDTHLTPTGEQRRMFESTASAEIDWEPEVVPLSLPVETYDKPTEEVDRFAAFASKKGDDQFAAFVKESRRKLLTQQTFHTSNRSGDFSSIGGQFT